MHGGARNVLSGASFVALSSFELSSFEQPDHSSVPRNVNKNSVRVYRKTQARSSKTERGVRKKPYDSYRQFRMEGEERLAFAGELVGIVGSRGGRGHALIVR